MSVGVPVLVDETGSRVEETVQVARGFGPDGAQPPPAGRGVNSLCLQSG